MLMAFIVAFLRAAIFSIGPLAAIWLAFVIIDWISS